MLTLVCERYPTAGAQSARLQNAPVARGVFFCGSFVAKRRVAEDPEFYFHTARPPLDFFDPKIRKVLPVYKLVRMIEVGYEVSDCVVPE
jgi:hypothetical protein